MTYRSEIKHMIDAGKYKAAICANLRAVAHLDPHAGERGYYQIRSLYFDNIADKALREKIDGVSEREKFRIRYYDGNTSVIHLEKKVKRGGLGYKVSTSISAEEAQRIVDGDTTWMPASARATGDRTVRQDEVTVSQAAHDCGLHTHTVYIRPGQCARDYR